MGAEGKKRSAPPLPAPTETESTILSAPSDLGTDLGTDLSRPGDDKSSYSIPEDGTPVTIRTGHRHSKSQTSLLIEYFEGGKGSTASSNDHRKPSVRVRLTPSSKHKSRSGGSDRDRIEITQTKSRKASLSRRSAPSNVSSGAAHRDAEAHSALDLEDERSYASATEESNVSRNPIDIEIDRGGNMRRHRPASPLIPAADGSRASYHHSTMSEISAIPTDSFLDGSGPTTYLGASEVKSSRSKSPSRAADYLAGAATGAAAVAAADRIRTKSRGDGRDKDRGVSVSKTREREKEKDRKQRPSKSRTSSLTKEEKYAERANSPRRKSSRGHSESVVSGMDSSIVSSAVAPSHRSVDQHSIRSTTSKASSINNPKLLETVEDAIRRLILPELNALKREQSKHKERRGSTSSATTASRDDYTSDRRRSSGTEKNVATPRDSFKTKDTRDREARNDFDDTASQSGISQASMEESRRMDDTPMRSTDRLRAAAVGAGVGAAALAAHEALKSPSDDKRSRRRRREMRRGTFDQQADFDDDDSELLSPGQAIKMPLMSEINPSDVTRASILSADSDRPHSASEELATGRGQLSRDSTPTPTRNSATLQSLGAQHANISHGDLKALPRQRTLEAGEFEADDYNKEPASEPPQYDDEEYDEPDAGYGSTSAYDYYSTQDVPPPLKYVPYQPERRGLSPIPSVSGYTEGGSEAHRESRLTNHTTDSLSSLSKSPNMERALRSSSSIPSNIMSRDFPDDDQSYRSSGMDQANLMNTGDSELDRVTSGQAVRAVGLNPNFVHPVGIESNVASLVDGSMLDGSVMTTGSSAVGNNAYHGRESMATLDEERSRDHNTPSKRSVESHHAEYAHERAGTSSSRHQQSREFTEYDLDEHGRKVPHSAYRQSPTASEEVITNAAVDAAAAALRLRHGKGDQQDEVLSSPVGVQRNQSFKERTRNAPIPGMEGDRSVAKGKMEAPKFGFNSLPDPNDPLPDLQNWQDDDMITNPSLINGETNDDRWHGDATPRQTPVQHLDDDDIHYDQLDGVRSEPSIRQKGSGHGLGLTEGVAVAAAMGAAAALASAHQPHSRQPSQEPEDEWYRNSEDRKRDTLVTNPYEGASPIANLPGVNDNLLGTTGYGNPEYGAGFATRSPLGHKIDEGYASQGPNKTPDLQNTKGKGVDFDLQPHMGGGVDDPFYTPKHTRHLSGLSQGMESPLYDASSGAGIDRIESKDIIALMQHLMVRDAQRSARDTEILVTLVRSATEFRNNFEDLKKMMADTEDVIITEVKENTDQAVHRAINGPRPFPGSGARSIQAPSQAGTDLDNAKKQSLFKRALKGLSTKGTNDLGRIEVMLNQLLTEVDTLKAQSAPGTLPVHPKALQSYDNLQPEIQYEQDRGYEPEGHAGTSTASHASQSGHLSLQSRASAKPGFDRRTSGHRISTVPEDNEEEYDHDNASIDYSKPELLMTPAHEQRGTSLPLATPPDATAQTQASMSHENTPKTADGKKKSGARTSWFPKISRWSETTTSSVAQVFGRRSGQLQNEEGEAPFRSSEDRKYNSASAPSRSGSLANYSDHFQFSNPNQIDNDKLHTGFSEQDLHYDQHQGDLQHGADEDLYPPPGPVGPNYVSMTPEDPKYKAHRNSLNLQHPQPRQGQTERFKVALESQAMGFDSALGPKSAEWAGSTSSLNRYTRQAPQDTYGPAGDQYQQHWTSSPAAANMTATAGPPRPPKEPASPAAGTPANKRVSKLQKQSPLPHHSVESGYGTMTHGAPTVSYNSQSRDGGSPRLENRNLSGALGVGRRPSGPRPMTPKSGGSTPGDDGRRSGDVRRKRDTFGSVTSQETDTF